MPRILHWFLRFSLLNPICIRLIGAASRRQRDLYIRAIYLGLLAAVLFIGLMGISSTGRLSLRELAAGSAQVFTVLATLQFILICVLTPLFMAGAIAKEANPRTWDILLTTPMSPTQIVLGNLFGRLFFILALSIAALPLMIVTQFFGGVPLDTILITQGVAICLAIVIAAAAITMSVTRTAGRKAAVGFFVVTIMLLTITFAIDHFIRVPVGNGQIGTYTTLLTSLNPFLVLEAVLNPTSHIIPTSSTLPQPFAWMVMNPVAGWCWSTILFSVVLVVWSSLKVRTLGARQSGISAISKLFKSKPSSSKHHAVSGNPIAWRERVTRHRSLGSLIARWGFLAITLLIFIILTTLYSTILIQPTFYREAILILAISEVFIVLFSAISLSASAVSKEREDGTLDLLLATALTPQLYLSGKLKGLAYHLFPLVIAPCLTMIGLGIVVLATPNTAIVFDTVTNAPNAVVPLALYMGAFTFPIAFIPFVTFCIVLGLLWSLRSRGSIGAIVTTLTLVSIVAIGLGLCILPASQLSHAGAMFAALSPITAIFAILRSATVLPSILAEGVLDANISVAITSVIAGAIWLLVCWGLLRSMSASFVMTVRRLAGQR